MAGAGGAGMALAFQWAPRSSTGQSELRAQLCPRLTGNKSPQALQLL